MSDTKVVVQCDDFGMCRAVNLGVVEAFRSGIVTQASIMVPCPWFFEAARLASEHKIPVGVHLTATSEWDYLRWGPLTPAPSLRGPDGRFPRTIEAVRAGADRRELFEEFVAQMELLLEQGIEPEYVDCHMGIVDPEPYAEVCRRFGKLFDYPIGDVAVGFDSIHMLSGRAREEKVPYLLDRISRLGPGRHLVVAHCAVDSPELSALTREEAENAPWANEYRVSDLASLTSSEVREAVSARGIELCSVGGL